MGKQAKLKAMRRALRQRAKELNLQPVAPIMVEPILESHTTQAASPPDLGIHVAEVIETADAFGRR